MLLILAGCCNVRAQTATPATTTENLEKRVRELEKEVAKLKGRIDLFRSDILPSDLTLCDKRIPLNRDDIRERFEREFFQLLDHRGLLTIVVKRYVKYMNLINNEIQMMSLPSDLIYLVVAESYLNPRAISSASAAGMWQFIRETGKREGLRVDGDVDERLNIRRSTHAALSHLRDLYAQFGDWFLAMAAYNAGPNRIKGAVENQGSRDFFDLSLPEETERYIFRIAALKEIITHRSRYGITVDEGGFYKPVHMAEVTLSFSTDVTVATLAKAMGVSYKSFKDFNHHIKRYNLHKGTYRINVPYDRKDLFLLRIRETEGIEIVDKK